jgi:hypothetical protein
MSALDTFLELGQSEHEGTGSGSHCGISLQPHVGSGVVWHGQALPVTTGMSSHGHALCVTTGRWSQGQAAFAMAKEPVAIPTAIAAATESFLIVI